MKSKKAKSHQPTQKIPREWLKRIKKIEIRSRQLVTDSMSGSYNSIFRGYGMEFEEVREYQIGDDFRRIDWNVTSRHHSPYIKVFKEERQLNVMLLVDMSGSLEYGSTNSTKREKMIETAAVLSFTAITNQDKIGAIFFTNHIEKHIIPSKNKNTILRLIRDLLFFTPQNKGTNIDLAVDFANETMKRRGVILILSDFLANMDYRKIFIAAKKHDIIPVIFNDSFEDFPINVGLVDMIDNETGNIKLVDTGTKEYKEYIKNRRIQKENVLTELKKLDIEPLMISTDDDVEKNIIRYFERRKKKIRI
ncbi:MAG: DUF58 domain-containing protein [Spirochaetes bacterium]|nr:DUF58 domain-containing protein [Spirochaetota bacterium]